MRARPEIRNAPELIARRCVPQSRNGLREPTMLRPCCVEQIVNLGKSLIHSTAPGTCNRSRYYKKPLFYRLKD